MSNKTIDFNPFEARLEAALHPVHPSQKFVQSMRQRIQIKAPVEVTRRLNDPPTLLLILGGVLSASLLVITAARAIFYLTNRAKI